MPTILLVKTSSMGDILHTLPAVTDLCQHIDEIKLDWVVEETFQAIPAWHHGVRNVIPVALRRWRKNYWQSLHSQEWNAFKQAIGACRYDYVIDAQGLLKSAFVCRYANGRRYGLDWRSAREPLASVFYQKRLRVDYQQHAIKRMRQLFATVLGYSEPNSVPNYAIQVDTSTMLDLPTNYIVCLHGTTREDKHYPELQWQALIDSINQANYPVVLFWSNDKEYQRAKRLSENTQNTLLLPKLSLAEVASVISRATACVAVDTGLGHLSAALSVPTLSLYAPTNPAHIGTQGQLQYHLRAPQQDFVNLSAEQVWQRLQPMLESK